MAGQAVVVARPRRGVASEPSEGELAGGFRVSSRAGTPRGGLGGVTAGGRGGRKGEWREGAGGPRGRGSVTTGLGRGNYNPAEAPAYRATSDPSKRVAWEFGW